MDYTHPIRRRARGARQIVAAASSSATWRRGVVVGAYWWTGHANFGDDLNPWLLPKYGVVPVHRRAVDARFVGVGSVLGSLPTRYSGAVWGSGLMHDQEHLLPHAQVLAVRGPLTRERIGASQDVPMGDPGLLVGRQLDRPRPRWDVGLVPHSDHHGHTAFRALARTPGYRVRVIDVHQSASRALREIAACRAVVTTSLHGLITADAFGIPAVWTALEPRLSGGEFKFRDYEATVTPGESRFVAFDARMNLSEILAHAAAAPKARVEAICDGLESAIRRLPNVLMDLRRFPAGLPQVIGASTGQGD